MKGKEKEDLTTDEMGQSEEKEELTFKIEFSDLNGKE